MGEDVTEVVGVDDGVNDVVMVKLGDGVEVGVVVNESVSEFVCDRVAVIEGVGVVDGVYDVDGVIVGVSEGEGDAVMVGLELGVKVGVFDWVRDNVAVNELVGVGVIHLSWAM